LKTGGTDGAASSVTGRNSTTSSELGRIRVADHSNLSARRSETAITAAATTCATNIRLSTEQRRQAR